MYKRYSRRQFVTGATGLAGGLLSGCATQLAAPSSTASDRQILAAMGNGPDTLSGKHFKLAIGYQRVNFTGHERLATTVNGSLPAPLLRWREGDRVTLDVTNNLASDSSTHWHGIILPSNMDGVPHLSFPGIKPGKTFRYTFDVMQSGTYWYHSHSGFQEQTGVYGAIIIDPAESDPVAYDREHVVVLSDWSDEDPHDIYATLKKEGHFYNADPRTLQDLWRQLDQHGITGTVNDRAMWNQMRMSDRDISDVTGETYTYLMNGHTPDTGWLGLFKKGEKVRLRIINASAMTLFDVCIPGLKMTVVAADGQNVQPVSVEEFRIGVAETYDVIMEPSDDRAYTVFAKAIDRSGYAYGTLSPNPQWRAEVPSMEASPILTHGDMGMAHHGGHGQSHNHHANHSSHAGHATHAGHKQHIAPAGRGSAASIDHATTEYGMNVDMRSEVPQSGIDDPGIGLRNNGRRVLRYSDLKNLNPTPDPRDPSREIQLHLTGNMHRYMWSINGIKFTDAEPLYLTYGERVRLVLVNDTMMSHPVHLHGMWSDLETGDAKYIPRKHTVIVQPGAKVSYLVTADAIGRWAYHCHLLYHMPAMAREVCVRRKGRAKV